MALWTRTAGFEENPVRAARARRQRFPWYFEMDSATLFMVGVTMLALICLLYLLQTSRVATLGYEIQQTQLKQEQAAREADSLRHQIAVKESLGAVESHARTRLKMRPVREWEYMPAPVNRNELRVLDGEPGRAR